VQTTVVVVAFKLPTVRLNVPELAAWVVSLGVKAPVIRSAPWAVGVKLTEQEAVVAFIVTRVHGFGVLNVPAAGVLKRTVPAGVLAVPPEVSFTKAVQEEAWFTITDDGLQTTVVVVARRVTVRVNVPLLPE
jgi:hypothetical protein